MSSKLLSLVENLQEGDKKSFEETYTKISILIPKLYSDLTEEVWSNLAVSLKRDFCSNDTDISTASVKVFSTVIENREDDQNLPEDSVVELLPEYVFSTANKDSVNKCFMSIFNNLSYGKCISSLHDSISKDSKNSMSDWMKLEIIEYVTKVFSDKESMEVELKTSYVKILQMLLAFVVVDNAAVRKLAVKSACSFLSAYAVQPIHIAPIASCLKTSIMPKIKPIYSKNVTQLGEVLTHQCPLFLNIMGASIRKSSSVINAILAIVEQGFRNSNAEIKTAAFKAWDCLINCFSEDLEVLSSSRYMKLLMQPLTSTQTTDSLNVIRIETLWGLARKLDSKLPALFSTVCLPIIHCCLGNLDPGRLSRKSIDQAGGPMTSRHSGVGLPSSSNYDGFYAALQASGYRATPKKASQCQKLHFMGVELLIHMLQYSEEDNSSNTLKKFRLPPLNFTLLSSPATFISNGHLFITVVSEVLCHMEGISDELCWILWKRLHYHVKTHLENNIKKKRRETELFNAYLLAMQNIVNAQIVSEQLVYKMIESFLELPDGILSSTFYGGSLNGMHGVPALCLLRLLFSRRLIVKLVPSISEDVLNCANQLILCGFENKMRILLFCQSVIDVLQNFFYAIQRTKFENSPDMSGISTLTIMIWEKLGHHLNQHILKSQEVNQGDSLDHDFPAMYSYLLFPSFIDTVNAEFIEIWRQVYKSFLWCASFVTTCKPNEICNHISSTILKQLDGKRSESGMVVLANICNCLVLHAEFNHNGFTKSSRPSYHEVTSSPGCGSVSVPSLDKHKYLAKLATLMQLSLLYAGEHTNLDMLKVLLVSVAKLFSSIHFISDICSLFSYFVLSLKSAVVANIEDRKFMREPLEEILRASAKALTENSSPNDTVISILSEADVTNFLCELFKQNDRKIKNSAVEFWNLVVVETDKHDSICKILPDDLRSALFPIYKQMSWGCPWKDIELPSSISVSGPSQDDNFTQSSMPPAQGYGAFGSPLKKHSFLSPKKSPLRNSSPAKVQIKTPTSVKRKLGAMTGHITYVKCDSPMRKVSAPLTEHQKEKMRERGFIPPMYNDLDEKQEKEMVVDTQGSIAAEKVNENKENSSTNVEEDIIKTSQSLEESTPKKRKLGKSKGQRKISLKNIVSIQEEEESPSAGETVPTRRRTRSRNKQQAITEEETKQQGKKIEVEDILMENANEEYKEGTVLSGIDSDRDSLLGESDVKEYDDKDPKSVLDTTEPSDEDVSYEYIEIADASTNQTHGDISIDEEETDDNKDLGVTPLDDSYEYVAVADMSMNVTAANQSLGPAKSEPLFSESVEESDTSAVTETDGETTKNVSTDVNDTADESVYEEIAVADMSTVATKMTMDISREEESNMHNDKYADCSHPTVAEGLQVQSIPEKPSHEFLPSNTIPEKKSSKNKKQVTEVRRSLRLQKAVSLTPLEPIINEDVENYISSDGESDEEAAHQKSLNETEYEYVEVADTSVTVVNNVTMADDENMTHEQENNVIHEDDTSVNIDESVYVVTDDETSIGENDDEEFIDARSSLGADSSHTGMHPKPVQEVIDISGSSASDIFETSAGSAGEKSVAECSAITIETSESDEENEDNVIDVVETEPTKAISTGSENESGIEQNEVKKTNPTSPLKDITKEVIIQIPKLDPGNLNESGRMEVEDSSPVPSSKGIFKVPALSVLQEDAELPAVQSPSAKGILKRRITIGPVMMPSESPNSTRSRRVSFAEPISKSKLMDSIPETYLQQSPRSSLMHRKKHSPRTVNRRLSLQPEKKASLVDDVPVSPLSLRSVRVAQAIANIRAKDPSSPSRSSKSDGGKRITFSEMSNKVDSNLDIKNISLKDLDDQNFISNLSKSQLKDVISLILKTTPVLHDALMKLVDT